MNASLRNRICELVQQHGGLRAAARYLGCDAAYLARLRDGEKTNPSPALLRKLGMQRKVIVTYERLDNTRLPSAGLSLGTDGEAKMDVESEIAAKGPTAPRVTPAVIEAAIVGEDYHVFGGSTLTVCCLTLRNGFAVIGESACASPENFDAALGRKIARDRAKEKIWALEGYALRNKLAESR